MRSVFAADSNAAGEQIRRAKSEAGCVDRVLATA